MISFHDRDAEGEPPARPRAGRRLGPRAVAAIALIATAAVAVLTSSPSARFADPLFVTATALTLGALIVLALRRVLVAVALVAALLAAIHAASVAKQNITDLALHSYDVVAFLKSWTAMAALWNGHPGYAIGLVAALAATAGIAIVAWRLDATRVRRAHAFAGAVAFAALAFAGAQARGERLHTEFNYTNRYLAFFFSSLSETFETLWRGQVIEAAAVRPPGPRFTIPASCEPADRPPHILLIHQESVVQPALFPKLRYDTGIDSFFRSHDGKVHRLRVETYGGASWFTEFSVMTGLSSLWSGGLRHFIQSVMTGKVSDTLPQALARCGYRNVAIYPMLRIYLSVGKFFAATGFHDVRDAVDQRAQLANERDRFYYANALTELERHLLTSRRPMFLFIETMATHGTYNYTYMPEVDVPGGGLGTTPHMHEYLRRLSMARIDYDAMRADLARRFPGEKFLIVHYGDHQPLPTRPLLGFSENASIEDVMRHVAQTGNDAPLITYYAVDGVGYAPPALPPHETLDVAYLGAVILESAGLPLSDAWRERKRLMALCDGRYRDCPARDEILTFHRRLIDSGLMDAL